MALQSTFAREVTPLTSVVIWNSHILSTATTTIRQTFLNQPGIHSIRSVQVREINFSKPWLDSISIFRLLGFTFSCHVIPHFNNLFFSFLSVLKCSDIPSVGNASAMTTSGEYEIGTNITFTCETGYYLPDLNTTMVTTCEYVGGIETNFTAIPFDSCYGKCRSTKRYRFFCLDFYLYWLLVTA